MTRLSDGKFGPSAKKLADLSDQELLDERTRRRGEHPSDETRPTWKRVTQYLANLELSPGATWPEVERAYQRLRDRYDPEKHEADPDRHRIATELNDSLTKAYRALRRYFQTP
ncbi:MAG: hypothetical protein WCE62_20270 [Polyangiales bacterium]